MQKEGLGVSFIVSRKAGESVCNNLKATALQTRELLQGSQSRWVLKADFREIRGRGTILGNNTE